MRKFLAILCLVTLPALADDAAFNGRWNIKVLDPHQIQAWWLEVNGAGTANPNGKFVGAPGGNTDTIPNLAIRDGELSFSFERGYRRKAGEKPPRERGIYRARLVDGKIEGTFMVEGQETPATKWAGVRAPVINEKDDGTWREGEPIQLFNGKNLEGWKAAESNRPFRWTVNDGILGNQPGSGNIISERTFWNFKVHLEFRLPKRANSGLGLRGRYEVQIAGSEGSVLESHMHGALYSRITPTANAGKPAGEWQTMDVTLIGRDVTVVLNGTKIIDKQVIDGPTAIAYDPNEDQPGPIFIQGDHLPIELRSVVVTPLFKGGTRKG